ncbi:MAG: rod shape-determining protein MreC [Patescibacteria group bacterium]
MSRERAWIIGLAVVGIGAVIALAGFARPIRNVATNALVPIAEIFSRVGLGTARLFRVDADAKTANARVADLEARLTAESVDYVRLRALEEENILLRAQANFISESGYKTLGARVISRAMTHESAVVMIDRGTKDGAAVGNAIVTQGGILVGKIIEAGDRTASVMLISDTRSRVAASISGDKNVMGIVEGRGDGVAHLTLVPQSEPLKKDQVIVTSGTESSVPSNLTVGLVNDVSSAPTDPFKDAVIEPLAPLDHLEIVSVIVPGA